MTPEERFERIERTLEFLTANQTQHDARNAEHSKQIGQLTDQLGLLTSRVGQLTSDVAQLTDVSWRLATILEEQTHINEAQQRRADEFDPRLRILLESQARTDQRLNTLINVVERYFSDGRQ
jgi:chromosome segregation ATPase